MLNTVCMLQVISRAVWWVLQHQSPEGAFYEVTWLPDRKMNTTLNWASNYTEYSNVRFRNISLTAHVLIMLAEVKDLTGVCNFQPKLEYWRII